MASNARSRRGSTAVEYAIVLPALLMFILGLLDSGRLLWAYTALSRSVEAAARCASINTTICGSTSAIQSYAVGQAWGLPVSSSAYSVTTPACGVQVAGTLSFSFTIPWFYGTAPFGSANAITLNAVACYPT